MAQKSFYVDSVIWLNLFKKEGDPAKGVPYWKIAKDFTEKIIFSQDEEIVYSGFILKEMKFKLDENTFKEKQMFFKEEEKIRFVKATEEDYSFARKLESDVKYEISFFDCLHIAICKRLNLIFVTRDELLIKIARKFIQADKPENLLS
jgi:predicted nucleic acid-binding protein